ncbi:MAG: radical SAM protein [Deltaproteobacteria bacterium]|nr:radical SAM protein [Deltaproteobacteria bacterium]
MNTQALSIHDHRRELEANRYVYAVLSRRSSGISIGVNLNPDKICNFDCIYCQVDRTSPGKHKKVELPILEDELKEILLKAKSGALYENPPFAGVPEPLRQVKDIAFSGDGEPTTFPHFKKAVEIAIAAKKEAGLDSLKIVVITNATMLHRPGVRQALSLLDAHNGEIWAKLDAGTEDYYRTVDATRIPLKRVLDNILDAARLRPVVIQSLFMRVHGFPPEAGEITAYCDRLREITMKGGKIGLVQIYTVARRPAREYVAPLSDRELDSIAEQVEKIPLTTARFYSNYEI